MKKWSKIILVVLGTLIIVAFLLHRIYLTARIIDQAILSIVLQNASIKINNIDRSFHWYTPKETDGGKLCHKLSSEHPQWIDWIAPNLAIDANLDCNKSDIFVPICLMNGTAEVNPYNGGLVKIMSNDSRGPVLSTEKHKSRHKYTKSHLVIF